MRKSAPLFCALLLSLSARRAWIEMLWLTRYVPSSWQVALRKESVDRNDGSDVVLVHGGVGRSPQGERG